MPAFRLVPTDKQPFDQWDSGRSMAPSDIEPWTNVSEGIRDYGNPPVDLSLPDSITSQDQSDIATHRMNPNLEPQYRQPMRDIPAGRDIQNQYDPGANIRPPSDQGGPAPAYGDPSRWNQPPPPVGVEGGGGWSYGGQGKPFSNNPMGGQITVPVYRTPLGQRSDAGPAGFSLHEIDWDPFKKDFQNKSGQTVAKSPEDLHMQVVQMLAPNQAIPTTQQAMSAYGNPAPQDQDNQYPFARTALNLLQPLSNTNGVPTYG